MWAGKDRERQQSLLWAAKHQNDQTAMETIIRQSEGLIASVIRPYAFTKQMWATLMHVGRIGIFKAIKAYDARRGAFSTFAWQKVRGEISQYFRIRGINMRMNKRRVNVADYWEAGVVEEGFTHIEMADLRRSIEKHLTPRQVKILRLLFQGVPRKEIAEAVGLKRGSNTVRWEINKIAKVTGRILNEGDLEMSKDHMWQRKEATKE
jgi:RNA polymerase sigma factor (sigma-70 family)